MYPSRSRTSQLLPQCHHIKNALGPISVAQAVTRPGPAVLMAQTRLMVLASCGPGSGRRPKVIALAAGFKSATRIWSAFDRLEQHRTGAEIGPVGRCLAWLRTLGAND